MHANDLESIHRAYRVIGVTPDSSALRIKRTYRRLATTWHPDKWPIGSAESKHAGEQMQQINDAFRLIEHAPLRYRFEAQASGTGWNPLVLGEIRADDAGNLVRPGANLVVILPLEHDAQQGLGT